MSINLTPEISEEEKKHLKELEECEHCLPKEDCIWCSGKYPDEEKLTINHCKKCLSMTNHYDGDCLRCKAVEEGRCKE